MNAIVKPKRCRMSAAKILGCQGMFTPFRPLQATCFNLACAIAHSKSKDAVKQRRKVERAERQDRRARLVQLKPMRKLLAEAQRAFNAWIRERDHGLPCICCGKFPTSTDLALRGHLWDAGHWRTVGAAPQLRFNEDNAHRQLVQCNRDQSGNALKYRARLIEKIGLERVEALEADNRIPHWSREQVIEIRITYQRKTREARMRRENKAMLA